MTDYNNGISKLLNLAKGKLSAASLADLMSLCREAGWSADEATSNAQFTEEQAKRVIDSLSSELGTDDLSELLDALCDATRNDDDVPPFLGQPNVGASVSEDARHRAFGQMAFDRIFKRRPTTNKFAQAFPECARLEAVPTQTRGPVSPLAQDGVCSSEKFELAFPEAGRIKL